MSDDLGGGWSTGPSGDRDGGVGGRTGSVLVLVIFVVVAAAVIWFFGSNVLDLW